MKEGLQLILYSVKRARSLLLVMAGLLAAFQLVFIVVANSIQRSDAFDQMAALVPDFVRQLMGPAFVSVLSYSGIVCVGYFHLGIMGALIGTSIALATESSGEIESKFLDLVLSRPMSRHWIITRSAFMVLGSSVLLLGAMNAGTWLGLHAFGTRSAEWPSSETIRTLTTNLALLTICWGGVALAIGSLCRRRITAGAIAGILALATYLLDFIARLWDPAQMLVWLSPFHYYNPVEVLLGTPPPPTHLYILAGVSAAATVTAYVSFSLRDL